MVVRGQCTWCGAPIRSLTPGAPCPYCDTAMAPAPASMGGPATCVCSVMAVWRCSNCDTPVCQQHRNRFWPGQSRDNIHLADGDEAAVWNESVGAAAQLFGPNVSEACTVCRAAKGADQLDQFRSIPRPAPTDTFQRMLLLARYGIWTPSFFTNPAAPDVLAGLVDHCRSNGMEATEVAMKWRVAGGRLKKVVAKQPFWILPTVSDVLLFDDTSSQIAGPLKLIAGRPAVPVPDQGHVRAETMKQGAYVQFTVHPRPLGPTPLHLGLRSYADLVAPHLRPSPTAPAPGAG